MMTFISDKKKSDTSRTAENWRLDEMENGLCFISDTGTEVFLEYDELAAVGPAYELKNPWSLLDVLNHLEQLLPGYHAIIPAEDVLLIRKRASHSPGLLLEITGRKIHFLKDPTLETINFLDFYEYTLKPSSGGVNEEINHNQTNSGTQRAQTGILSA